MAPVPIYMYSGGLLALRRWFRLFFLFFFIFLFWCGYFYFLFFILGREWCCCVVGFYFLFFIFGPGEGEVWWGWVEFGFFLSMGVCGVMCFQKWG